jgi:hypothetical protein
MGCVIDPFFCLDSGHVAAGVKFIFNLPMSARGIWVRAKAQASSANKHPYYFCMVLASELSSLSSRNPQ